MDSIDILKETAERLRQHNSNQISTGFVKHKEPTKLESLSMESRRLIRRLAEIELLIIELINDPTLEEKLKKFGDY